MKKRILSVILSASMLISMMATVKAEEASPTLPNIGDTISGFTVEEIRESKTLDSDVFLFTHEKTGAQLIYIANEDTNRAFNIAFRTPGSDTGIAHVFEHATLGGSQKYPKDIFFNLIYQTSQTNMNASTAASFTQYFSASISDAQLLKLMDYYLDGVFNPIIKTDKSIFDTEAWRYELESPDDELTLNGTVYSEMKGVMGSYTEQAWFNVLKTMFPNSCYATNYGGDPDVIPTLAYDEVVQFHNDYYKPSNAIATIYGKLDYEKYLELFDEYFSKYDDQKPNLSDKNYTPISGTVEKEFTIPGSGSPVMTYAFTLPTENDDDYFSLLELANILTSQSSPINMKMQDVLPDVSCSVETMYETPEPILIFFAQNIDEGDKDLFKSTVDEALEEIATQGIDKDLLDSYVTSKERSSVYSNKDLGTDTTDEINTFWSSTNEPLEYFKFLDFEENMSANLTSDKLAQLTDKYLVNADKRVIISNIPDENLAKEKDTALKNKLAEIKANMTDEEIAEIVAETTEEDADDTEVKNALVKQINVSNPDALRSELQNYKPKEYDYTDETIDDVRYITATTDTEDVSEGGIYFDVSSLTDEQLKYLSLYAKIYDMLPGENYSQTELDKLSSRYFDYLQSIDSNDDNLYYIFNFVMLNEDISKAYETAYEMLFTRDFSDTETLKSLVNVLTSDMESNIVSNPNNVIITRANAQKSSSDCLGEYANGLTFYDFLKEVSAELEENPETVVKHLNEVVSVIKNKNNATSLFVGNASVTDQYKEASEKFFAKLPNNDLGITKREFYVPEGNEAVIIDSDVNYNIITASLDEANIGYDGDISVTGAIVTDKLLVPYLRYNKGAYGSYQNLNENELYITTYRDPQLESTYAYYNNIGDLLKNSDITQDELNGYIVNRFVSSIDFDNEFENTYDYIATKVYDSDDDELYYKQLKDYLDTTIDMVKSNSEVYNALAQNGTKHTMGNESDIIENADLFDTITMPLGSGEIYIYVDGERIKTDTAPVLKDSRVYVPLAVISEALGSDVNWDAEEKSVTISSDDKTISLSIGSNEMLTNGEESTIDAAPEIMNERTMVPLRAISEAFDKTVDWKTGCVIIK